jgi:hypothetical protein
VVFWVPGSWPATRFIAKIAVGFSDWLLVRFLLSGVLFASAMTIVILPFGLVALAKERFYRS